MLEIAPALKPLLRPLKRGYLTADQLEESSWEPVEAGEFRRLWQSEAEEAASGVERERLHLATGLLLPVWDKPMEVRGREPRPLKRSLVNGSQRVELTGWSAMGLDQ